MSSALQGLPRGWGLAYPEVWAGAESGFQSPPVRAQRGWIQGGDRRKQSRPRRGQWGSGKRPARGLWKEAELCILRNRALTPGVGTIHAR